LGFLGVDVDVEPKNVSEGEWRGELYIPFFILIVPLCFPAVDLSVLESELRLYDVDLPRGNLGRRWTAWRDEIAHLS